MIKLLNIAICDDDISITGKIEMLVREIAKRNLVEVDTEVFWNGKTLLQSMGHGINFDIIYLDIEMENGDGISTADTIRTFDKNVIIMFVSSHENYMKDSFKVRPFRFIVKPVEKTEFELCFKAAYDEICSGDYYFQYRYDRTNHKIPVRDILYFESMKRKVAIVTEEETYMMSGKLNDIEMSLKDCKTVFLRVHQSFLVNYKHIVGQAYNYVILHTGQKISISEDRRKRISEQYCTMEDTFRVIR